MEVRDMIDPNPDIPHRKPGYGIKVRNGSLDCAICYSCSLPELAQLADSHLVILGLLEKHSLAEGLALSVGEDASPKRSLSLPQ